MPPSSDARETFFTRCIGAFSGLDAAPHFADPEPLATFLDDPEIRVLRARVGKTGNVRLFTSLTETPKDDCLCEVAFVKKAAIALSPADVARHVQAFSLGASGDPVASLHEALRALYCPILLESEEWSSKLAPGTGALISDLEKSLRATVKRRALDGRKKKKKKQGEKNDDDDADGESEEALGAIVVPTDELDFWEAARMSRALDGDLIHAVGAVLEPLRASFEGIDALTWSEAGELVEQVRDALEAVWKAEGRSRSARVAQARVAHFIRVVGAALARSAQARLRDMDPWTAPYAQVRAELVQGAALCEKWCDTVHELTAAIWPSDGDRPWEGDAVDDDFAKALGKRFEQVLSLRSTHEELAHLLRDDGNNMNGIASVRDDGESKGDAEDGDDGSGDGGGGARTKGNNDKKSSAEAAFAPFAGLRNPILYNAYTDGSWASAVADYEASLAPVEAQIAANFRRTVASFLDSPQQLLFEFKRFQELVSRPHVKAALSREREALLQQLLEYLEQVGEGFDATVREEAQQQVACNLSVHVAGVVAARQVAARVGDLMEGSQPLFGDLRGYRDFEAVGRDLLVRSRRTEHELLNDWALEVKEALKGGDEGMRMRGQLMEIDRLGVLTVNFSSRLVQLLREVRQLTELGLVVPAKIGKAAEEGERYYRFGVMLKKVANFFNSMETQILRSQRPMLLNALVAFEDIVERRGGGGGGASSSASAEVTWSSPGECELYVDRLQHAAAKLAHENRQLRRVHDALGAAVVALLEVDLLKQRDLWKARWQEMQHQVAALEHRYEADRMSRWVLHWDHQVYKVLEAAYCMGLETLNESLQLPDSLKVDLGFFAVVSSSSVAASDPPYHHHHHHHPAPGPPPLPRQRVLALRPSLEELRSVYYRELKKFVSIPSNSIKGLLHGANADVYRRMAGKNTASLVRVYHKAERLFSRLAELEGQYEPQASLARVPDLEALVEVHCRVPAHFEANFRALKARRRDAEKSLPDFVKVDCVRVSLGPLKSGLEVQHARLEEALLTVLRRSVTEDFRDVDAFMVDAVEKLAARPQSIEDIALAQRHWRELDSNRGAMRAKSGSVNDLAALLVAHAAGQTAVDATEAVACAAGLEGRWVQFDEQMEAFNEMVDIQKESLKSRLEEAVIEHNQAIDKFAELWRSAKPTVPADPAQAKHFWAEDNVQRTFADLDGRKAHLEDLKARAEDLAENFLSFNMPVPPRFDGLDGLERQITSTSASWGMLRAYRDEVATVATMDWITFRNNMFALQDIAAQWADKIKDHFKQSTDSAADSGASAVLVYMASELDRVKAAAPALKYCHGKDFKDEHWSRLLQGKLGLAREVKLENLTVGHFVSAIDQLADPALLPFVKQLQAQAQGEVLIREALQELAVWAQTAELTLMDHEEAGRHTQLIKEWKDLFLDLGDKQSLLASLKESQFYRAFEDVGSTYETKLSNLDFILHSLNSIQRKWVYLEPIFGRGALPNEQRRFKAVDDDFREIMATVKSDPKLFGLVDPHQHRNIRGTLETMLAQLERCQKALADFLEEKRGAFPRFYFIGDDDLLEILGQAKNPAVIQSHLKKLFQGVHEVRFDRSNGVIEAMVSSAGEVVELDEPVKVTDKVEEWLAAFTDEMKATLASRLATYLAALSVSRRSGGTDDVSFEAFPSQVLCIGEQVRFCDSVEAGIGDDDGSSLAETLGAKLRDQLELYTRQDLSGLPVMQLKVKALVMDLVHNMDVLDHLARARCQAASDWAWHKQLRYYAADGSSPPGGGGDACSVRMADASFTYTFEYQGNAEKLVHTPLTDKCYLTLTSGMHMGFGGNPYGPAGTGKTESVKALGNAMGRQVLVFNCDEGIDFHSMGRIFIGLVKCGAWGCFDEFNRLKEDQLSAISQQIQIIQDAIKTKAETLQLLGRTIDVDINAGIFVTLNPAGKDYGGRSQIPDNLKALFRPVAMGRPDNDLIAEVYMRSEGFTQAKGLAVKVVSLFTLSKQLLTQQRHYDWGLRALKAILNTAGKLVRAAKKAGTQTPKVEGELLISAVRVNTLSKLTFGDTGRFLALIGDVFPGVESSDMDGGAVEAAIRVAMRSKPFALQIDEAQIRKMLQLKESLDQRMGCVVVGPSGCGKSTVWRVLQAALQACGQQVKTYVMNPKSMPRQQLLGEMDLDTREWADGVLTDAARQVVREPSHVRSWIVCDGDVDPEWIESLNSVLDDNHLLTLPNGERIAFGENVNFLFETHDLRFASPATVSRMGMIFLSDEDIEVKRVCAKWLDSKYGFREEASEAKKKYKTEGQDDDAQEATGLSLQQADDLKEADQARQHLEGWIDDLFYRALDHVNRLGAFVVETTLVGTVMNALSSVSQATTKAGFVCGLIRGLGGNLPVAERSAFAKVLFEWAQERPPDLSAPLDCAADDRTGGLYSFAAHCGGVSVAEADFSSGGAKPSLDSVITTVSTQRALATLEPWVASMEPFILVGPEGCGKNMIIRHAFARRRKTSVTTLHCNAQTTADHVVAKIAQCCSLFSAPEGRVYRPRDGDRLVLYLKDLNLPRPDMYETCMLIAFLQQVVTFGGFYDKSLEFLRVEQVQIVASMNPATTVGRHPLSTRFTATVRVGVLDYPDATELTSIYTELLEIAFAEAVDRGGHDVSNNLREFTRPADRTKLAATLVEIYERVKATYTVDDKRHYLFTPRDLTAWVKALLRYDLAKEELLNVVAYEGARLFRDRMVDHDAAQRLDGLIQQILRSRWKFISSLAPDQFYFTTLGSGVIGRRQRDNAAAAAAPNKGGVAVPLLERLNADEFLACVVKGEEYYERENSALRMHLFPEILDHVARVDRVVSCPGGNLLLVGRSGVGRRSAAKLVAYMRGYDFASPSVMRTVTDADAVKHFRNELKPLLNRVAVEGTDAVLYVEDHHFACAAVLELVNSLLSAGEVPGLYTNEELEGLFTQLRETMMDEGSELAPYDFFLERVKRLVHVCVAMDPTNPAFALRCESNPALFTACTILWMGDWRKASMRALPMMLTGVDRLVCNVGDDVYDDDDPDSNDPDPSKRGGGGAKSRGGESKRGEGKSSSRPHGGGGEGKSSSRPAGGEGKSSRPPMNSSAQLVAQESKLSPVSEMQPDDELVEAITAMHESCVGASPREFVLLLQSWKALHGAQRGGIRMKIRHLTTGLSKLEEAAVTVDRLSKTAEVESAKLAEAQKSADAAMEMITKTLSEASGRRSEVTELTADVREKEQATRARKGEIEDELSTIKPVIEAAKAAVGQIKAEHLNEIRSLKMPPEPIADVLGAVLKLLGISDVSWSSMKKFLSNRGVKDEILHYDAHRIGGEMRKDVARLLKQKAASFDHATITRVSVAAAPLAAWVKANIRYSVILEKIRPLEEELHKAEAVLERSAQRLKACEEEISTIDERVGALKLEFGTKTREAEALRHNMEIAKTTLDKAEALLGKLGGEQTRWQAQCRDLKTELLALPRQLLLAAGFVTYLARCPEDVRDATTKQWCQLVGLHRFSFAQLLATESQLLAWKQLGLPADSLSQENALVISHGTSGRVPFVVDPASASRQWLMAHFSEDASRPLEAIQSADPRFVNHVELAVRFGKTLLIFDVDGLEPLLYPLARQDVEMQGPRMVIRVGDKMLDYNENFRLALVTRNPRPELPPDAAALVTEINFTVTRSGLEGQLLGLTIQHEQPELETKKTEMLRTEEDYKIKLAALEKNLLEALATAEGDLLENTVLIESLTQTKVTAREIQEALKVSGEASVELDRQRETYRSFARDGSTLYFLVRDLVIVNAMYQFSLASFLSQFDLALRDPAIPAETALPERLARLTPLLERLVFFFVGRGLFKADQCMFALHVVHGMHPEQFREHEWEFFTGQIGGGTAAVTSTLGESKSARDLGTDKNHRARDSSPRASRGDAAAAAGPAPVRGFPNWANHGCAAAYADLTSALPSFARALDLGNATRWGRWAKSAECERDFPAEAVREATPFQRVLVVKIFRPDRLLSALKAFACEALGVQSLAPPSLSFEELYRQETRAAMPTLLITTAGADPSKELADFATSVVGASRFKSLAMGGGTQQVALGLLQEAAREGTWLCLQNLHLVVAFLPALEKALAAIGDEPEASFRLWLTTEPHAKFPRVLLQQSLKVTFESPPGTKKNLQRTLTSWGRDFFDHGHKGGGVAAGGSDDARKKKPAAREAVIDARRKLLLTLAWFHAVMQERRTYLPQGWTKFYEFSVGDLRAGAFVMEAAAAEGGAAPDFDIVRGIMEDAVYGGRVDNPYDLRVLRVYLGRLFSPEVFLGRADLRKGLAVPTRAEDSTFDAVFETVGRLPEKDAPALLGLPDNVERSVQRRAASLTADQLRTLTVSAVSTVHFDRELWRAKLGPILEQWASLVDRCPALAAANPGSSFSSSSKHKRQPVTTTTTKSLHAVDEDPIVAFVAMENEKAAQIAAAVDAGFVALKRVVYGTALLTPAIAAVATALIAGNVPAAWSKLWEGPARPAAWIAALGAKTVAVAQWAAKAAAGSLMSQSLELTDVFRPSTFLNALRQLTARKAQCPIDELVLVSAWSQARLEGSAPISVVIAGLLLQGAELRGTDLLEAASDAPEFVQVPPLTLGFAPAPKRAPPRGADGPDASKLVVPIYHDASRETLLVDISLPVNQDPATWILAGVAIFLTDEG